MTGTTKHPEVKVKLAGEDGNAFAIVGRCAAAMQRAGLGRDEIEKFHDEAMSGNYDHLLVTCVRWFDCD